MFLMLSTIMKFSAMKYVRNEKPHQSFIRYNFDFTQTFPGIRNFHTAKFLRVILRIRPQQKLT